jgi:hypothetical protein
MTIHLNSEQEGVVGRAIRAGLIRTHEDAVEMGIASIRQRLNATGSASALQTTEDWFRELSAWSESHSTATPLLPNEAIDRESIYGARGL